MRINWCENKSISLSMLHCQAKGGWVLWGYWGPDFFPNSREVKSARTCFCTNNFSYTFDTEVVVFMVEEEVDSRKRNNAKPLALATVLTWYAGEWKANRVTPV